jgi:hypothetical protein
MTRRKMRLQKMQARIAFKLDIKRKRARKQAQQKTELDQSGAVIEAAPSHLRNKLQGEL